MLSLIEWLGEGLYLLIERLGLYIERGILKFQIAWIKSEIELVDRQLAKLESTR